MEYLSYADGIRLLNWDYLEQSQSHQLRPRTEAAPQQSIAGLFSR